VIVDSVDRVTPFVENTMNAVARTPVRDLQPELMDRPDLDSQSHYRALRGLARLNRWSRAAAAIWQPLKQLSRGCQRPLQVLDIATGGGDVLCDLARKAQRCNLAFDFAGCDVSPRAIEFARQRADRLKLGISFFTLDVLQHTLPSVDVVISSLFFHHLNEEQATSLLSKMAAACREMIVINDLRRSRVALSLAYAATQLLTRSPVVHVDGPRSVQNAFTVAEIRGVAERAGLADAEVKNCWPQRLLLCWQKEPGNA
jgi:2-polyprenyl-3-methyl-5-hydroxy-6-metoxy-1,4-benzoquinol methylase